MKKSTVILILIATTLAGAALGVGVGFALPKIFTAALNQQPKPTPQSSSVEPIEMSSPQNEGVETLAEDTETLAEDVKMPIDMAPPIDDTEMLAEDFSQATAETVAPQPPLPEETKPKLTALTTSDLQNIFDSEASSDPRLKTHIVKNVKIIVDGYLEEEEEDAAPDNIGEIFNRLVSGAWSGVKVKKINVNAQNQVTSFTIEVQY